EQRTDQFDAILAGPYLHGLTYDVAKRFPGRTILVPCFHDEPLVRLRIWRPICERVAGICYHSPEEKAFAEVEMGLNHPFGLCIGAALSAGKSANKNCGKLHVCTDRPYVVYCGRYSRQKNLPTLIEYARRYQGLRPDRFIFVFVGQGEFPIPR